jgi:acyl-CoA synthetase (NDP forming)
MVGVSTSGAGCAILADSADKHGLSFFPLSEKTLKTIEKEKGFGVPMNPFDIGASNPISIGFMSGTMANDDEAGFVLFYSTILQTEKLRKKVAELYSCSCKNMDKMPFIVIAPGPLSAEEMDVYRNDDIVVFQSTDPAMDALRAIIEAGSSTVEENRQLLQNIHRDVLMMDDGSINQENMYAVLQKIGIPVPKQRMVASINDVMGACHEIGYPVVIKGISTKFTHKSDLGLVWVDVSGDDQVKEITAYLKEVSDQVFLQGVLIQEFVKGEAEVFVGVHKDPDVGYVLLCGSGGKYTEILDDIEICMLPTSKENIAKTFSRTKIGKIINGYRNNGLSPDKVVEIAYRIQRLLFINNDHIVAIDFNPIILNAERATVVDMRMITE